MSHCKHHTLVLIPEKKHVLRCRYCHLTIDADELQGGYCPECYENHGRMHYDFDTVESPDKGKTRYRCEECGLIIEVE